MDLKNRVAIIQQIDDLSELFKIITEEKAGCAFLAVINLFNYFYRFEIPVPQEVVKRIIEYIYNPPASFTNIIEVYEELLPLLGMQISEVRVQKGFSWNNNNLLSKKYVRYSLEDFFDEPVADGHLILVKNFELNRTHVICYQDVPRNSRFINIGGGYELKYMVEKGYRIHTIIGINKTIPFR